MGKVADELCVVRSMVAEVPNHEPSLMLMNCGDALMARPSLGSWVTYGLGTENQNLPAFVVMTDGSTKSGPPAYGAGFLPALYQGTVFRGGENPILYLQNPPGIGNEVQRETLDFIGKVDPTRQPAWAPTLYSDGGGWPASAMRIVPFDSTRW